MNISADHPLDSVAPRWAAFGDGLAVSEEPLRERLHNEYAATLMPVIDETVEHLPPPVRTDLREVNAALTSVDGPEGSVSASIAAMSDEEVYDAASKLLDISHVVGAYAVRVFDD